MTRLASALGANFTYLEVDITFSLLFLGKSRQSKKIVLSYPLPKHELLRQYLESCLELLVKFYLIKTFAS